MLVSLAWCALVSAPLKIAVPPLQAGEGVQDKTVATLTESVAAEIRKAGLQVITQDEIKSVLSFEEQKQIAGCTSDSCIAEIGGALGVDRIVSGSVSKLGESWLLFLKLIDVKRVTTRAQADRRLKKANVDDVLDVIPTMVKELLAGEKAAPAGAQTQAAPPPSAVSPPPAPKPVEAPVVPTPSPLKETPKNDPALLGRLIFYQDAAGHVLAVDMTNNTFFAGTAGEL